MASVRDPEPAVAKSIEKARAAVKGVEGDGNLEWLVARLLYEKKFGTPEQLRAREKQLLGRQNADGGWGALTGGKSDAFSTGQALYALRVAGAGPEGAAVLRGQQYLLGAQEADGSWAVSPALTSGGGPARLKKLEPIWRNWGSAWATIGLARSLPRK